MSDRKREYSELLKDPRWQRLRLQVFERDEWQCQKCSSKDKTLNVHHKKYEHGKKPWEYPLGSLLTLCEECHTEEYKTRRESEDLLLNALREKGVLAADILILAFDIKDLGCDTVPRELIWAMQHALEDGTAMHSLLSAYYEPRSQKAESTQTESPPCDSPTWDHCINSI